MEKIIYRDIDLTFNFHPTKRDVNVSSNQQAIMRAIRNLILTQYNEKPFQPRFGSNVRTILFENVDFITAISLRKEIEYSIKNYEPRVDLKEVIVIANPDHNLYEISIIFTLVNSIEQLKVDFVLTRLR